MKVLPPSTESFEPQVASHHDDVAALGSAHVWRPDRLAGGAAREGAERDRLLRAAWDGSAAIAEVHRLRRLQTGRELADDGSLTNRGQHLVAVVEGVRLDDPPGGPAIGLLGLDLGAGLDRPTAAFAAVGVAWLVVVGAIIGWAVRGTARLDPGLQLGEAIQLHRLVRVHDPIHRQQCRDGLLDLGQGASVAVNLVGGLVGNARDLVERAVDQVATVGARAALAATLMLVDRHGATRPYSASGARAGRPARWPMRSR